ncbi:MAG: hypothetical protein JWP34_1841 [Massilia sp.]|nr:hypothetical protein [Massilia sp.]
MKTMKWLLRREYWENKGAFFWAPAIIAGVMLVLMGATVIYGAATHGLMSTSVINGHEVSKAGVINAMPLEMRVKVANIMANTYLAASAPLFGVLPVVAFFYCLAALYDDRRDRSILFWKSLPVSDQMTVLSKVLTALCVAPVLTIAIGTAASLLMVFIGLTAASFSGLNLFGLLLKDGDFYLAPLRLIGLLPVYALWAIPTVGWLLMVSAWARSKVFLWAVGIPVLSVALARWVNFLAAEYMNGGFDVKWYTQNIVVRGLGGLVPGIWVPFGGVSKDALVNQGQQTINAGTLFTESWMTLTQPGVWVGVVVGALMIFAAMRLRRWRDEG